MVDMFDNKITLRFYFNSATENITHLIAEAELEKIKNRLTK